MKYNIVTPALLQRLIDYNPKTGAMTWLPRDIDLCRDARAQKMWNARSAGKPALAAIETKSGHSYFYGRIMNMSFYAHRVAYAIGHGSWPVGVIDHRNGNGLDNRLKNLRDVPQSLNVANSHHGGRDLPVGVTLVPSGRFCARLGKKYLGTFDCPEDAGSAYRDAHIERFGSFSIFSR